MLRVEVRIEGQFRHAEDSIHRRADLVAHVGQELTLGAAGRFRCFLGLVQLLLRALAIGNILVEAKDASQFAIYYQRNAVHLNLYRAPVLAAPLGGHMDGFASHFTPGEIGRFLVGVVAGEQPVELLTQDLGLAVEEKTLESLVAHLDAMLGIRNNDGERTILDQRIQVRSSFLELFFRPLAFGDVDEGDHGPDHLVPAADGMRPKLDRKTGAVGAPAHLIIYMDLFSLTDSLVNPALFVRIGVPSERA